MNRVTHRDMGTGTGRAAPLVRGARRRYARLLGLCLCLAWGAGCATSKPHVDKSLLAEHGSGARNTGVAEHYLIGCPDVLEVTVAGRPELATRAAVGTDGCIGLGTLGKLRVEGHTPPEVARMAASRLSLPPEYVEVWVADYRSQCLYLFGEVNGLQRAVAYRGQETVLDLLQRVGGITQGAAPDEVYVVRSRVADGERPEVFYVDLEAIVVRHDLRTNLRLQPFDQVHVGATRRARLVKCLPPWLRPLFNCLCGRFPTPHASKDDKAAP